MRKMLLSLSLLMSLLSFGADTLHVGVNVMEPFVGKTENGYKGVTVDLFNEFLKDTNVIVDYTEYRTAEELISSIKSGVQDMGIGPITITPSRYQEVNFTQPYYRSSISIAYDPDDAYSVVDSIMSYMTIDLLYGVLYYIFFLWLAGVIIWWLEMGENEDFKGKSNMFLGIYFAFMIFSTVGFGDLVPKTKGGKVFTIFFGTLCLMVSGFFVANIASSSTLNKLDSEITISNLNKKKVGTLRGCTSADFLDNNNVRYIGFESAEEGINAIKTGELDVFVYDTPILQYSIEEMNLSGEVVLSEETYEPQFYGFPVSKCCHMDEIVNPIIVKHTIENDWKNTLSEYNLEQ